VKSIEQRGVSGIALPPITLVRLVRKGYKYMPGQKVLVVDDSWTELTMIVTPLRNSGFEVVTAVDGDEAVEKVFKEHPQCIVLDVVLPKQNGFQLCRRFKSLEASRHIPIILLTSKNTPLDKAWGLRQGADLYVTKPFNTDELVASVRRLV
jgi:DNA-binding response OmpR family regulator